MRARYGWSLLLIAPWMAAAASAVVADPGSAIDGAVQAVLQRSGTPGAVVAVYRDDALLYRHAYGLAVSESRTPATTDTYFEIGSITKQFTAAAILQLQEAGKLDINAKLATYLPDAPHAQEVTLKQLLSHTSGMPEYLDGPDEEQTRPQTYEQLIARIKDKPLDFPPGSRWAYCNTGYLLLGRVISTLTHDSYNHYVKTHLLAPAGMTHTYTVADEASLKGMAVGYQRVDGKLQRALTIHDTVGGPAGNLVSTVDDVQRWNRALSGGKIISPADVALMGTSVTTTERGSADYGLGLFVESPEGEPRIGHTGGSLGFTTANWYFPNQHLRIIVLTNLRANPEPGDMASLAIFDTLEPAVAAAARQPAPGEDAKVTAATRELFAHLQRGNGDIPGLSAKLGDKMKSGLAARLAGQFASFGAPLGFIYKGERHEGDKDWRDYLIDFGPGSTLKFGVALNAQGEIVSLTYG